MELRQASLASLRGTPVEEEELRKREEVLTLEDAEHSLYLEQLEMRECQVAQAEDTVGTARLRSRKRSTAAWPRLAQIL